MSLRKFKAGDWKKVVSLWNRTLWSDRIWEDLFLEQLLLDPNFDPDGFWVVEENGELKAAAIGWVRVAHLPLGIEPLGTDNKVEEDKDKGFLCPLLIEDSSEGIAHGQALLNVMEEYFRERKRKTIFTRGIGPSIFLNGVDKNIYPGLYRLHVDNGYKVLHTHYSMRADLRGFRIEDRIKERIAALEKDKITFHPYNPDDLLSIREYFLKEFRSTMSTFKDKLRMKAPYDEFMIVKKDSQVVGYCQYNYYGQPERVGPFGVAQSMRGHKVGQAMVAKLLEAMTRKGYQMAYFNYCTEENVKFYAKNGFTVFGEKSMLQKELQP